MKKCCRCKLELTLEKFYKRKDGFRSECKDCQKKYNKDYSKQYRANPKNKECHNKNSKKWYANPKNKKHQSEYRKQWLNKPENKARRTEWQRKQLLTDIQYKISQRLRTRLWWALKGNFKSGSAVRDLGCLIPELKIYLEKQFKEGMSWENHGKWHIDHKLPLKSFDLTDRNQLLKAVHYTNLQPLWAFDNLSKGCKLLIAI